MPDAPQCARAAPLCLGCVLGRVNLSGSELGIHKVCRGFVALEAAPENKMREKPCRGYPSLTSRWRKATLNPQPIPAKEPQRALISNAPLRAKETQKKATPLPLTPIAHPDSLPPPRCPQTSTPRTPILIQTAGPSLHLHPPATAERRRGRVARVLHAEVAAPEELEDLVDEDHRQREEHHQAPLGEGEGDDGEDLGQRGDVAAVAVRCGWVRVET